MTVYLICAYAQLYVETKGVLPRTRLSVSVRRFRHQRDAQLARLVSLVGFASKSVVQTDTIFKPGSQRRN